MSGDPLIDHLRGRCLQVMGSRPGAGFYATCELVVTCAHVVGATEKGARIGCRMWAQEGPGQLIFGTLLESDADQDLAILRMENAIDTPVRLSNAPSRLGDPLVGIGYPVRKGREEFDQFTAVFEGRTEYRTTTSSQFGAEEKFKSGQVERGFSGGPLLNLRTNDVIGVTIASRETSSDLGGWAIPSSAVTQFLTKLKIPEPSDHTLWDQVARRQARPARFEIAGGRAAPFHTGNLTARFIPRIDFSDRAVRELISDAPTAHGLEIVALQGGGGVGKSTLAAAIAQSSEILRHFPDGVLWTELGLEPSLLEKLHDWISIVVGGDIPDLTIAGYSALLRNSLRSSAMLLVVDNVWDVEHLKPFLVGGSRCRVLMTTRRVTIADAVGAATIKIDVFSPVQAMALIMQRVPALLDIEGVTTLAARLGHIPLAIELLAALLSRGVPVAEISRQLTYAAGLQDTALSNARQRINSCFLTNLLFLQRFEPEAWSKLILLGLTAPNAILGTQSCATIWGVEVSRAEAILWRLVDDSLVSRRGDDYWLHDLLRELLFSLITQPSPTGLALSWRDAQHALIERYRTLAPAGRWNLLPADGYIHRTLVWHAMQAQDSAMLLALISAREPSGGFAWYAARARLGEHAGYLDDMTNCQRMFADEATLSVSGQLQCALSVASISSGSIWITPKLLIVLVAHETWSVATAYTFLQRIDAPARKVELLVALVAAIDQRLAAGQEDDLALSLRPRIMSEVANYLGDPPNTHGTAAVWGAFAGFMPEPGRQNLIERRLFDFNSGSDRARFVDALPPDLRPGALDFWWSREREERGESRVDALEYILTSASQTEEAHLSEELVLIVEEHVNHVVTRAATEDNVLAGSRRGSGAKRGPEARPPPSKATDYLLSNARRCVAFLSTSHLARLDHSVRRLPLRNDAVADFLRSVEQALGDARIPIFGGDPQDAAIDRAVRRGDAKRVFGLLSERKDSLLALISKAVAELCPKIRPERICLSLYPLWVTLSESDRFAVAEKLRDLLPTSAGGRALAAALSPNIERFAEGICAIVVTLSGDELDCAGALCAEVGLGPFTNVAALRAVRIGDTEAQAMAVLALIPYLPPNYSADLLDRWRDSGVVGSQIATLTDIVRELGRAISADALTAVVEAAIRKYSEWWIIEALTTTLRHIHRADEFAAVLASSDHIRANDMRARLIGRTARRAADFGHFELALTAHDRIPAGPMRWDELVQLAQSCAAIGRADVARRAAANIAASDHRSRAFSAIVVEIAAQGRLTEADAMIETDIVDRQFKEFTTMLTAPARGDATAYSEAMIAARLEARQINEPTSSELKRAVSKLQEWVGDNRPLLQLRIGLLNDDGSEIRKATRALWTEMFIGQELLAQWLATQLRAPLLERLRDLAPLVGAMGGEEVVATIGAIREVGASWP